MQSRSGKPSEYTYVPRGTLWAVYNASGEKVSSHFTREEARKEVYRLNGWKYNPQKT